MNITIYGIVSIAVLFSTILTGVEAYDCVERCKDKCDNVICPGKPNPPVCTTRCHNRCESKVCGTPKPSPSPTKSPSAAPSECQSKKKLVQIIGFEIDGDLDIGDDVEVKLKLQGTRLDTYYKVYPDSTYSAYSHTPISIAKHKILKVGLSEHDSLSPNDRVHTDTGTWFDPTCEPYELKIVKQFASGGASAVCISGGLDVGQFELDVDYCSTSITYPQSVAWYVEVKHDP